jgi:hypothetical protein
MTTRVGVRVGLRFGVGFGLVGIYALVTGVGEIRDGSIASALSSPRPTRSKSSSEHRQAQTPSCT